MLKKKLIEISADEKIEFLQQLSTIFGDNVTLGEIKYQLRQADEFYNWIMSCKTK